MFQLFLLCCSLMSQSENLWSMEKQAGKRKRSQPSSAATVDAASSPASASASAAASSLAVVATARRSKPSYYRPQRTRGLYDSSADSFKLSRSKLENFVTCPTCFFIDRKLGKGTPPGYPFTLNSAVDKLCKKEFDAYRATQTVHPLCVDAGVDAVPFAHPDIEKWRNSLRPGLQASIEGTNIILQGGIDDVWQDRTTGQLIVVDYKATAKKDEVSLDADWQDGYKRQIEMYQYLLRRNGHNVSNRAYFVYANGKADEPEFGNILKFRTSLLPYDGNDAWVEPAALAAYACLQSDTIPSDARAQELAARCQMCQYAATRIQYDRQAAKTDN